MGKFLAAIMLAGLLIGPALYKVSAEDSPAPAKIVTAYLFVQCGEALRVVLVASDGTSRVMTTDYLGSLLPVLMQLPVESRLKVALPNPKNGCPVST